MFSHMDFIRGERNVVQTKGAIRNRKQTNTQKKGQPQRQKKSTGKRQED